MLSRIARIPLIIPSGVDVTVDGSKVTVKGPLGQLVKTFNSLVQIIKNDNEITLKTLDETKFAKALSGTIRAILNNMVTGVTKGFEKKLTIFGVGYRAALQGVNVNLSLGFSHPVIFETPVGIKIELPTPTEVVIKGIDKEIVGQCAAIIRAYRPVEPYKGKGVRYANEQVTLKETKKK